MNELALFCGAGGGLLGSRLLGWRTVCGVEVDPYCREVVLRRQEEGHLEPFPIWDDVRNFDGKPWRGAVDIVTAGFPCQPFSVAGRQQADMDERNMWPETVRVLGEVRPQWALLENVPGLLAGSHGYFWTILGDLAAIGFDARWGVVSAADVGAPHRRARLWIVAHSEREGELQPQGGESKERRRVADSSDAGSNINGKRLEGSELQRRLERVSTRVGDDGWWSIEPGLVRMVDGIPNQMDRIKCIGNAQVPRVVVEAWRLLSC